MSSRSRVDVIPDDLEAEIFELTGGDVHTVALGGAVVFVLPIVHFERIAGDYQAGCSSLA